MVNLHNDTDSISSSIVIALNEVIQKIHQLSNVLFVSWSFIFRILNTLFNHFEIHYFHYPRMLNVQSFLQEIFIKYIG